MPASSNYLFFLSFQLLNKVTVIFPVHFCSMLPLLPSQSHGLWCKWNFKRKGQIIIFKRLLCEEGKKTTFLDRLNNQRAFTENTEKLKIQVKLDQFPAFPCGCYSKRTSIIAVTTKHLTCTQSNTSIADNDWRICLFFTSLKTFFFFLKEHFYLKFI